MPGETDGPVLIELRGVHKRFGTQTILRDIRLKVNRGETLVLIGESGCGKSVTLKLIMRLLVPEEGDVLWDGSSLAGRSGLARALSLTPEIVLYHQPTTGLDPIMSDVINELIIQTRSRRPVTSVVVTHDMTTVRKVADRVLMLYPLNRLEPDQPQVIFDGTAAEAFSSSDPRVSQFVHGEARDRLNELAAA